MAFQQPGTIPDVFVPHQGLVVGKGHSDAAGLFPGFQGQGLQLFRVQPKPGRFRTGLGNGGVLAEGAAETAAPAAQGQDLAAGMEPAEGLFLYGSRAREVRKP